MNHGRRVIYTDERNITAANVIAEVNKALLIHTLNRDEVQELYDRYRGITPIQNKEKEIRPEINHKINENIAYEIVTFHKGYGFGEDIQCIRREASKHTKDASEHTDSEKKHDAVVAADINALNAYFSDTDKHSADLEIAEWMLIGGEGRRYVTPKQADASCDAPFRQTAMDPRTSFCVYSSGIGHELMMGVSYVPQDDGIVRYTVYTRDNIFEFSTGVGEIGGEMVTVHDNPLSPFIPIIDYPANRARMGCFEAAVPLLDAIDELQSNRMDDIVQHVNSFLAILGGELTKETYEQIQAYKMLALPEGTDAKYLSDAMDESDIQTLKDDLRQAVLTICSMPNRNGGSSTSDTGVAVVYRDGWEAAESFAKGLEAMFKKSEKTLLRIVLMILKDTVGTDLTMADIESHFNRRNYANMQTKAQILAELLACDWVHPELAFKYSNIDADPESAYLLSKSYHDEVEKKNEQLANANTGADQVSALRQTADGSDRESRDKVPEMQSTD